MKFDRKNLSNEELLAFYERIMLPRMIEEKMLILLRQGKISKWFSGYGQEAISVGTTLAMSKDEYILPMHRNLGVFTSRDIDLFRLFCQFRGTQNGFTQGHDRSFHFGVKDLKIVGMISHLGPQLGIADGLGLAAKLAGEEKAVLVFSGDGATSEGDFHEALNVAAVWDLPVLFVIENNGYGLSTPSTEQFRCKQFIDKAIGYGMEAFQCNGNNLLDVYHTTQKAADRARNEKRPFIIEALTFRIRGHEEASGTKYYPDGLIDKWIKKDPVTNFEQFLIKEEVLSQTDQLAIKKRIKQEINNALDSAFEDTPALDSEENEYSRLFVPFDNNTVNPKQEVLEMRFVDAIKDALDNAMQKHDKLVLMGQDIAEYGGVFKVTEGFVEKYGRQRVRNTPLCESAIIGTALGLSVDGYKAMVEMQFADFVTCGFNQIVNNLAKIHWRWGQNADVVVRMPTGAGVGAGPFHSQSNEAWFFHTPGLRVIYPSNPLQAKGLLLQAFEDPNPVMFFEHKALYRSIKGNVPQGYYTLPFGKAEINRPGNKLTVITYGAAVHWLRNLADENPDLDIELLDLVSLAPLDRETIFNSVKKTHRALIVHEDCLTGGIGAEIAALVTENCFEYLDAPVRRLASLDTPVPFAENLEKLFLPQRKLMSAIQELLAY